jgi:hypothetical protein
MLKNWKTTLTGVAVLVAGAILIAIGQVPTGIALMPVGLGFIVSKDHDVTGGTIEQ